MSTPPYQLPPNPAPLLEAASREVDRLLLEVAGAPNRDEVGRHAALLAASVAREAARSQLLAADMITTRLVAATQVLDNAEQRLAATIHEAAAIADKGTGKLATWTMVLAIVTGLLMVATVALVLATWRLK